MLNVVYTTRDTYDSRGSEISNSITVFLIQITSVTGLSQCSPSPTGTVPCVVYTTVDLVQSNDNMADKSEEGGAGKSEIPECALYLYSSGNLVIRTGGHLNRVAHE